MAWSIASQREILGGKTLVLWKGHAMLDAEGFNAVELTHNSFDRILSEATAKDVMEQARRTRKLLKTHGHLLWLTLLGNAFQI